MKKALLICLLFIPLSLQAATQLVDTPKRSRSVDHIDLKQTDLGQQLETAEPNAQSAPWVSKDTSTRALQSLAHSGMYWLTVYDSEIFEDQDQDGYYRGFTLSFEPEVMTGHDHVYADIYLSYEGGTWHYLTSSQTHFLSSSSGANTISITSELDYGYPTGYYDVLIELRDASTDRLLVSAGPDTEGALGYLPLEDGDHDADHYHYGIGVDYYAYGSGSLGLTTLLLSSGMLGLRRAKQVLQF